MPRPNQGNLFLFLCSKCLKEKEVKQQKQNKNKSERVPHSLFNAAAAAVVAAAVTPPRPRPILVPGVVHLFSLILPMGLQGLDLPISPHALLDVCSSNFPRLGRKESWRQIREAFCFLYKKVQHCFCCCCCCFSRC